MRAAKTFRPEALALAFFVGLAAFAPQQVLAEQWRTAGEATKPVQIDKNGLLILIRSTLYALDLSNKSGNYTILREISAPGFAAVNDAARLSALFRSQRERNLDYSGVLVYEPTMTALPETGKDGMMHFAGFFPSASSQINFEMIFAPVNGQWKLFGLAADLGSPAPAAPMPAPQQAPQPVPAAKNPAAQKLDKR